MFLSAEHTKKMLGISPPEHKSDYSEMIMVKKLPLLGRLHFVQDKAGILSVLFVLLYWVYGTFATLFIILLPMYNDHRVSGSFIVSEYFSKFIPSISYSDILNLRIFCFRSFSKIPVI